MLPLYYSICQLTQLEILDMYNNTLNMVPEVVSSLTSLKQLDINQCGISSLPERFVCHLFITTTQHPYYISLNYIYTQFLTCYHLDVLDPLLFWTQSDFLVYNTKLLRNGARYQLKSHPHMVESKIKS